jgi:hypothetical protein
LKRKPRLLAIATRPNRSSLDTDHREQSLEQTAMEVSQRHPTAR